MKLARLLSAAADALLPPRCVLCGIEALSESLCGSCAELVEENSSACARCALPLPQPAPLCGHCIEKLPPFDAAFAGFVYREPFAQLVQRLKFSGSLACARALGPRWATALGERRRMLVAPMPMALIPVPLYATRLRKRGFNQAVELARELQGPFALPVLTTALVRTRATTPQPGLDLEERKRNLRDAFAVSAVPIPARIALVDDVMTTGATLSEAAKTLKRAGAEWVELWVLARRP